MWTGRHSPEEDESQAHASVQRSQLTHGALTRSSVCAVCQALALLTALRAPHFTDLETEALTTGAESPRF